MSKIVILTAILTVIAGAAAAGIVDPCRSSATFNGSPPEHYVACPHGDTETFSQAGFSISFRIVDMLGNPVATIPKNDFWVIDGDPARNLALCGGSASSHADGSTDPLGRTTMSQTTLAAGGCANGLQAVCQGNVLGAGPSGPCPVTFDVRVRSIDVTGDLRIDLADLSALATHYPPAAYDECYDIDGNGRVSLSDVARLAAHWGHAC